jgi:hypothetical protein
MTATIHKNNDNITLINIFSIDLQNQQRLVDLLIEDTEQIMNKQEDIISVNIHKSLDDVKKGKLCPMEK